MTGLLAWLKWPVDRAWNWLRYGSSYVKVIKIDFSDAKAAAIERMNRAERLRSKS